MNDVSSAQPVRIRTLASGSSGNALVVATGQTTLLFDAGISLKRIEEGLAGMDAGLGDLDAVVLTHEHGDHISSLSTLLKRRTLPVWGSPGTLEGLAEEEEEPEEARVCRCGESFCVGDLQMRPFAVEHDAREPTGFRVESDGFAMGIATDLGSWDATTVEALSGCQIVLLEANHDLEMLRRGPYPAFLKRRIAKASGHLSNDQARSVARRIAGPRLEQLVLVHLSGKNNDPDRAVEALEEAVADHPTIVRAAPRKEPGPMLRVVRSDEPVAEGPARQTSLFS